MENKEKKVETTQEKFRKMVWDTIGCFLNLNVFIEEDINDGIEELYDQLEDSEIFREIIFRDNKDPYIAKE